MRGNGCFTQHTGIYTVLPSLRLQAKENIYCQTLCIFEHSRDFLRQNLYPWSVLQRRITDPPQDQTSQILAKLRRLGFKLFLYSYLHQAPAGTIPLESLREFKVLFPQRWQMLLPLQGLPPSSPYKRICWAGVYIYSFPCHLLHIGFT